MNHFKFKYLKHKLNKYNIFYIYRTNDPISGPPFENKARYICRASTFEKALLRYYKHYIHNTKCIVLESAIREFATYMIANSKGIIKYFFIKWD